jgi:hypothetical protein
MKTLLSTLFIFCISAISLSAQLDDSFFRIRIIKFDESESLSLISSVEFLDSIIADGSLYRVDLKDNPLSDSIINRDPISKVDKKKKKK